MKKYSHISVILKLGLRLNFHLSQELYVTAHLKKKPKICLTEKVGSISIQQSP